MKKIIAACGNDCSACPRYINHPYEKTEEELKHTAELWMKIGYRDHIVTSEEISCTGCKPENWCRYRVVKCCEDKKIRTCAECMEYPCNNMLECFEVTKSFEPMCQQVCSDEEYKQLKKAFFEKEKNLSALRFYQKRGFEMARLYRNAVEESRIVKPQIPLTGEDGIPIRHEIELEMYLGEPVLKCKIASLYICVNDMERAIHFYEDFFDMPVTEYDETYSVFDIAGFRFGLFAYQNMKEDHPFGSNCLPSIGVESVDILKGKLDGKEICFPLTRIKDNWVAEFVDSEGNHIEITAPAYKTN